MNIARDFRIDFLRFLGLTLIVLAHVEAPFAITQLRSFDVPLMVFVSGLCFKYPSNLKYGSYIVKRLKRLYIPTFIFLIFYFLLILLAKQSGFVIPYEKSQIIGTFLLLEKPSIGYVWIIRVFILIALISPLVYILVNSVSSFLFAIILVVAYFVTDWIVLLVDYISSDVLRYIFEEIGVYTLAYGLILAISLKIRGCLKAQKKFLGILSIALLVGACVFMLIDKQVFPISELYKYPPHSFFLLYGIACSLALYWLTDTQFKTSSLLARIISYISERSLWVYLWHIPFVVLANSIDSFASYWFWKWILCYAAAIIVTFLQVGIINYVRLHYFNCRWFKYLIQ